MRLLKKDRYSSARARELSDSCVNGGMRNVASLVKTAVLLTT
jgi:hypothetical protein